MQKREFAKILVDEVINNRFDLTTIHKLWESCELDRLNLCDKNNIWRWYVNATLHWGGVSDDLVNTHWKRFLNNSILFDLDKLLGSIMQMRNFDCFDNFTHNCRLKYKQVQFLNMEECCCTDYFDDCPMKKITNDLSWHRHHYKTAKIFIEAVKRLFILNDKGKQNGNMNDVVSAIFEKHRNSGNNWRSNATEEFFMIFENMNSYPLPAKSLLMFISDMSMPFLQVNHWPDFDLLSLIPVDTHVGRLSHRFRFVGTENPSFNQIKHAFQKLYPENPRYLSFAMFLLGGSNEMNICTKYPKCVDCKKEIPKVFEACPYTEKLKY